ncbi:multidrug resistance protein fnx1 [Cryptococcus deuterogattii 99/473]|uniref:Multidrug resistance protein fnx1 n=1 Tax=Cryptococcus deuterogattii Ram5 TaxID=1296110 RepID=A0A0D0V1U5_9TREE|nr:multidrug resistance protein fnx1 [Cryptococcus deuterogattii LA55]KIR35120.1 multidrug resistance protein fnx1 [Cryptococcus deuterogattii MMRL2647]KIR40469.1 multidrug resistance protein fnx1 [Cryptococcus deuterogattii Ram5]KIR72181.1 multidrug resistance protein fnx1 [Cryptococcus deuterogattii CA1014]KIR93742.1 multidrug resistance protein fnx1 [Cryptococcus deuterogattii CBS 10090]KIS00011.1 multidrug resistance protein fnx1 [Cryptococcus deuterogattii 2001/935-1]KIY58710.1 multidrug
MSAIVITTASYPSERTALLRSHSYSSSDSGRSDISTDSPNQPVRSAPLKDSISLSRFVVVCVGVWSANFVFAFQSTAIPTLAPEIGSWFEHGELSAYLGMIPLYGVFMETLGRKFAMVTACLFFGAGTIMCASAGNMYTLIGARTFAGLGGGGLLTVSSVIVTDLVPLRDRGYYQGGKVLLSKTYIIPYKCVAGLMMTIFGSGSMLGGPVAGWLTDRFGWHWSFWIQLPVIVFCGVIVSVFLPTPHIPPTHRSLLSGLASLDWLGTALLIGSVTTLIFGFSFHTSYLEPWSSPAVWGMLLASVLSAAAFVLVEMKVKRPLVPLRVFKSNHISAVMLSGFFLSVSNQAFLKPVSLCPSVIHPKRLSLEMVGTNLPCTSCCGGISSSHVEANPSLVVLLHDRFPLHFGIFDISLCTVNRKLPLYYTPPVAWALHLESVWADLSNLGHWLRSSRYFLKVWKLVIRS